MSVFSNNLKVLRLKSGLLQSKIAEFVGITASTWSNYEIGKTEPNIDTLVKIANAFNVSMDGLTQTDLSAIAENLIKGNLILNEEGVKKQEKGNVKGNLMGNPMAENSENQPIGGRIPRVITVDSSGVDNIVLVPVRARAGYLAGYEDSEFIQSLPTMRFPGLNQGTYRAFEIYGHSMVPTFSESDLIICRWVENFNEIRDDRVYVVVTKRDGVVAKRVINRVQFEGKLILNSDNQRHQGEYPPIIVDPEEVLEVWYGVAFLSRQMRSPKDVYNRLNDHEARLTIMENNMKNRLGELK